ncbi:MAG: c-type cytochrome [Candidatus Halalkalibacterium sp. M3_1C_030]
MKYAVILIPVITLTVGVAVSGVTGENEKRKIVLAESLLLGDTTDFDQEKALEKLREGIKGRENEPAGLVFDNIKTFERLPADRLLRIMEMGFSKSLGVNCTHCHNPKDWGSEEKNQKQIARDMMAMVGRINNDLLGSIENLESETPIVNCTTCHRGQIKPATNIER